jgi:hypothetical protein
MKKLLAIGLVVLIALTVVLSVAACGSDTTDTSAPAMDETTVAPAMDDTTVTEAPAMDDTTVTEAPAAQ